ncbi:hypothetical protein CHH67_15655 [Paenibacillus campinasensis]|uniref:Intimin n=2 Tax=Paenibacillus campinasensis TaxID=66347 RepID=A0A268EQA0_9BACL|nr:hypothetical protein CHH67_15655 [Paenibacillus campinasensis]
MRFLRKSLAVLLAFLLVMTHIPIPGAFAASGFPTAVRDVGAGNGHSMFIDGDGNVWALGNNEFGQLGNGTTRNSSRPVQVAKSDGAPLTGARQVAGGFNFSVALLDDGTVWSWGQGSYGRLGNGATDNKSAAEQVTQADGTPLHQVQSIATGKAHTLALKEDGTVWGWGENAGGVLTDNSLNGTVQRAVQLKASSGSYLTNVKAVAAGEYHSMALRNDGTVWAWGNNFFNGLGNGSSTDSIYPVQVIDVTNQPLTGIIQIAHHRLGGLALKADGSVWSWGYNENYNLGVGTGMSTSSKAVQVLQTGSVPLTDVAQLGGGDRLSMVIKKDGSVWWWGLQNNGYSVATRFLEDGERITGGDLHSLIVKKDGTLWGHGWTVSGELGISSSSLNKYYTNPVQVYPATSRMYSSSSLLDADGTSKARITVTLYDGSNLSIGRSEGTVELHTSLGEIGPVTDHGDGRYSADLTSSNTAGTAVITGTLNGYPIPVALNVIMVPLPPSIDHSTVTASPSSITADGRSTATITVQLKDASGTVVNDRRHAVQLATTAGALGNVQYDGNGTYMATLTSPTTVGLAEITASVNGAAIRQTATVQYVAGSASADMSRIETGAGNIVVGMGSTMVTVHLKDAYGNPLETGGDTVQLYASSGTLGAVRDHGNGTYTSMLNASTTAGTSTVRAEVNGMPLNDSAQVVFVPGRASSQTSELTAELGEITADGSDSTIIHLQMKDAFHNLLDSGGSYVVLNTTAGVLSPVQDHQDGTYTAVLTAGTKVGIAEITGSMNGLPLLSTVQVQLLPGPPAASTSTLSVDRSMVSTDDGIAEVTIQLKDAFGNELTTDSGRIQLASTLGTLTEPVYTGHGRYTSQIRSRQAGKATITATINDTKLAAEAEVEFIPGKASLAASTIVSDRERLTANGTETAQITLQLKDDSGNPIVDEQALPAVELNSSLGSLSAPVYEGEGRFTARLTSTQTGLATVTARIDGSPVSAKAYVEWLPGQPDVNASRLLVDQTALPANGSSHALLTLHVSDAFGNPASGTVQFISSLGTVTGVTYASPGLYTAELRSTETGIADIQAWIDGEAIPGSVQVAFSDGIWLMPSAYRVQIGESVRTVVEVTYGDAAWDRTAESDFHYDHGMIQVARRDDGYWYITGLQTGTTVIQAVYQAESGPIAAYAPVTVFAVPTNLVLDPLRYTVKEGEHAQIAVFAEYSDGTKRDVSLEADYVLKDNSLAAIDVSGRLLGLKPGSTEIIISFEGLQTVAEVEILPSPSPIPPPAPRNDSPASLPAAPIPAPEPALMFELQLDGNERQLIRLNATDLKSGEIVIDTTEGEREWTLHMKRTTLDQLRKIDDAMVVTWNTPLGTMVLPIAEIGDTLSGSSDEIILSIRAASDKDQSKVESMAFRLGATLQGRAFSLSMATVGKGGNTEQLVPVQALVQFRPSGISGSNHQVTVATVNEATDEFIYAFTHLFEPGSEELTLRTVPLYALLEMTPSFADMRGHWAEGAAEQLASRLIVQGTGQGKYEPARPVTRAELASMLVRMFGWTEKGTSEPFSDVASQWYSKQVHSAYEAGWIQGYADGTFRPDAHVTRQELFVMLARALQSAGYEANEKEMHNPYADQSSTAAWAERAIDQLRNAGLLAGTPDNKLEPARYATRAELAVLLARVTGVMETDQ